MFYECLSSEGFVLHKGYIDSILDFLLHNEDVDSVKDCTSGIIYPRDLFIAVSTIVKNYLKGGENNG